VTTKLDKYDEDFKYLREKVDGMKAPKIKSYDGDIIKLKNEIDKLKGEIARLEKLLKDPLSDFR
jgi:peptidoglycan hydrolase CwlO-like protein